MEACKSCRYSKLRKLTIRWSRQAVKSYVAFSEIQDLEINLEIKDSKIKEFFDETDFRKVHNENGDDIVEEVYCIKKDKPLYVIKECDVDNRIKLNAKIKKIKNIKEK